MTYIMHRFIWERKPSYSKIIFDGCFDSWETVLQKCLTLISNPELDTGEPLIEYKEEIPSDEYQFETVIVKFGYIQGFEYSHKKFIQFWLENEKSEEQRLFRIEKITV